jgi:hypothetical protein
MMLSGTPSGASSHRVCVAELVGRQPPPDARLGGEPTELDANAGADRPRLGPSMTQNSALTRWPPYGARPQKSLKVV